MFKWRNSLAVAATLALGVGAVVVYFDEPAKPSYPVAIAKANMTQAQVLRQRDSESAFAAVELPAELAKDIKPLNTDIGSINTTDADGEYWVVTLTKTETDEKGQKDQSIRVLYGDITKKDFTDWFSSWFGSQTVHFHIRRSTPNPALAEAGPSHQSYFVPASGLADCGHGNMESWHRSVVKGSWDCLRYLVEYRGVPASAVKK